VPDMTNTEKDCLTELLHGLILRAVPKAETRSKYGGVLYTVKPDEKEGQFCGVFGYKGHVQLSFSRGATLDDPAGLLKGGGKLRRHISFTSPDELPEKQLIRLLKAAAKK